MIGAVERVLVPTPDDPLAQLSIPRKLERYSLPVPLGGTCEARIGSDRGLEPFDFFGFCTRESERISELGMHE